MADYWDNAAFGTTSPAETSEKPLSMWDKLFGGAINSLATLPKRAIDASTQDVQYLGDPNYQRQSIAPAVETAMTMTGGAGIVPAEANTLRAGIKVVKAGKDTYNIIDHEGKVLANADIGIVDIGGKKLAQIDDINTPALNNVTTQAEHDAAVASGRNALGTGHMREAMRQFLEMNPGVEGFTGNRVSGARNAGAMGPGNIQNITVGVPMSYENLWNRQ